jgi:hypothetical protein
VLDVVYVPYEVAVTRSCSSRRYHVRRPADGLVV